MLHCLPPVRRVLLILAVLVLTLAGSAGTAVPASATLAFGARSDRPAIAIRAGQVLPGFTGGPITAGNGETVTIYVQNEVAAADPSTAQRFADYLVSLLHGPELQTVSFYIGTIDKVHEVCGGGALGCYSPTAKALIGLDQDYRGIAATSIITHEYGHHVANSRVNDPWAAVDWGTKRWSSYVNVCKREKTGELFPGDEGDHYELNPGEDFAETYRVLNERRLGRPEMPWLVVDSGLYPDQGALDALAADVTTPWTANRTSVIQSRFTGGATGRGFRVQTPYDGAFVVSLRAPANSRFTLRVVNLADGSQLGYSAAPVAAKSVSFQVCGQRSVQVQVKRVRGAGAFTLTVSQP
jgi:hypothetical protein